MNSLLHNFQCVVLLIYSFTSMPGIRVNLVKEQNLLDTRQGFLALLNWRNDQLCTSEIPLMQSTTIGRISTFLTELYYSLAY